jgi:hypothetical protein
MLYRFLSTHNRKIFFLFLLIFIPILVSAQSNSIPQYAAGHYTGYIQKQDGTPEEIYINLTKAGAYPYFNTNDPFKIPSPGVNNNDSIYDFSKKITLTNALGATITIDPSKPSSYTDSKNFRSPQLFNPTPNTRVGGSSNQTPLSNQNQSPKKTAESDKYNYKLLAPLPGLVGDRVNIANGLGSYLNNLYTAGIAIATGLAVLMIVIGGIQYVSSDAIGGKSDGKQRIQDAIIGLLLAFMSYLLLNTLNPDLLNNDLKLEETAFSSATLVSDGGLPRGTVVVGSSEDPTTMSPERKAEIAESLKTGRFDKETNDYLVDLISKTNLVNITPRDVEKFFPGVNGQPTAQDWANFIAGITKAESGFNPNKTYKESFVDNSGKPQISEGYLQLSRDDVANYKMTGIDPNQIQDPSVNLQMGVIIMDRLVSKDGVISDYTIKTGKNGKQYRDYQGPSEYWSTLR